MTTPPDSAGVPAVSVIIVNWNGRELLGSCLDALRAQTCRAFEVLLVDNASADGSADWIERAYPEVRVLRAGRNLGFAAGNNLGLRQARGAAVALLNNDAVADPTWLESLLEASVRHPGYGFFASKIVLQSRPDTVDACGDYFTRDGFAGKIGWLDRMSSYSTPYPIASACAAAALYRRTLFDDVGGFDEDFFMTHEDTDLGLRAQLRGHRGLFVPDARVVHRLSASLRPGSWRQLFLTYRNEEYAYLKNMPARLLRRSAIPHLLRGLRRFASAARRDGLRGAGAFAAAKAAVLCALPGVLRKRRRIQESRRISEPEFEAILSAGVPLGPAGRPAG